MKRLKAVAVDPWTLKDSHIPVPGHVFKAPTKRVFTISLPDGITIDASKLAPHNSFIFTNNSGTTIKIHDPATIEKLKILGELGS